MTDAAIGGGHVDRILLGRYLGVELLGHMVSFNKLPNCFPKWLHHFTFPLEIHEVSNFSTSSPTLGIVILFDYSCFSVQCGYKRLNVVLISIFLMMLLGMFSHAFWPFVCLLS